MPVVEAGSICQRENILYIFPSVETGIFRLRDIVNDTD